MNNSDNIKPNFWKLIKNDAAIISTLIGIFLVIACLIINFTISSEIQTTQWLLIILLPLLILLCISKLNHYSQILKSYQILVGKVTGISSFTWPSYFSRVSYQYEYMGSIRQSSKIIPSFLFTNIKKDDEVWVLINSKKPEQVTIF